MSKRRESSSVGTSITFTQPPLQLSTSLAAARLPGRGDRDAVTTDPYEEISDPLSEGKYSLRPFYSS